MYWVELSDFVIDLDRVELVDILKHKNFFDGQEYKKLKNEGYTHRLWYKGVSKFSPVYIDENDYLKLIAAMHVYNTK